MSSCKTDRELIVAVDDSEDDRFFFSRLVRKAGITSEIQSYAGGEEAINGLQEHLARRVAPLVCFLDVKMPGVTGFDVLGWIRKQSELDDMPVLMLSSSEHTADLRRAEKRGAQCYLSKHPSTSELREIMRMILDSPREGAADWLACPGNIFARRNPRQFQHPEGDE